MIKPLLVYVAGVAWDGVEGTDHRLVEELRKHVEILWVDPPRPLTRRFRPHPGVREPGVGLSKIDENLWRLHVLGPPAITRPLVRKVASMQWKEALRRAIGQMSASCVWTVLARPGVLLRELPGDVRVYFATDDFVAGAPLLGMDPTYAERVVRLNVFEADLVFAVSPVLVTSLGGPSETIRFLPNGCSPERMRIASKLREARPRSRRAAVVGQINERLDVALLLDLARAGVDIMFVGPRYESSSETKRILDQLLVLPNVGWHDRQPFERIPELLGQADLGLTPYVDSPFNRASFPLKTLEYLAAGLRVVSTDLPSARSLETDMIDVAPTRRDFVDATSRRLEEGWSPNVAAECHRIADANSWAARADTVLALLAGRDASRSPHWAAPRSIP